MTTKSRFDTDGYDVERNLFDRDEIDTLRAAADRAFATAGGAKAGVRDVLSRDSTFVAAAMKVRPLAQRSLGDGAFVVRSILFDKSPTANWDVLWHQDVTIAVKERIDLPGFGPWSTKGGIVHVQPPADVLEQMTTLRIHLDDCVESNGPLLVVPSSHANGIVDVRILDPAACEAAAKKCCVSAGDVLLMRPLTLHASRKSTSPNHRRVLHLEFAARALPKPLEWHVS